METLVGHLSLRPASHNGQGAFQATRSVNSTSHSMSFKMMVVELWKRNLWCCPNGSPAVGWIKWSVEQWKPRGFLGKSHIWGSLFLWAVTGWVLIVLLVYSIPDLVTYPHTIYNASFYITHLLSIIGLSGLIKEEEIKVKESISL